MKKSIVLFVLIVLAVALLASCSKVEDTSTPDELNNGYDPRFDNTVEDAVDCYFSLLTEDGFANYLLAFPEEFVDGYQHIDLEYDDATFKEAIENATYSLHVNRDEKYMGYEFHIDYAYLSDREVTGSERAAIVKDLGAYCHMTTSTIEKVYEYVYDVNTYGYDEMNDEMYFHEQENKKLILLYITEAGWYVSPTNFELP